MIIVKTPMRVSLFGGGTDYPAHFREHGGAVLGMAIDKYVWTAVRRLPPFFEHKHRIVYSKVETVRSVEEILHPAVKAVLQFARVRPIDSLEIHHDADLPARSGMGSSSAFVVGLLNAVSLLNYKMPPKKLLADFAIHVEQEILKENVGCQDQVWAAYGGLNRIDFFDSTYTVHPIIIPGARTAELTASIALYFTGFSRSASEVLAQQMQRTATNLGTLNAMREMVDEAFEILTSSQPIEQLGYLLNRMWKMKKELSTDVSTPEIDAMYDAGLQAGAWGGKLLGAGSGGFMMFMVHHGYRQSLRTAMNAVAQSRGLESAIEIPINIDYDGSKVVVYQPDGL